MNHRRRKVLAALIVAVPVTLALVFSGEPPVAEAQVGELHLEYIVGGEKTTQGIPGNCSMWHELWPAYCAPHHQDGYEDNGDSVVSECDIIVLDGQRYHVVWVGPTYWLTCQPGIPPSALEPTEPGTGGDPTCEVWHEVYPNFCQSYHVDGWEDNGNGFLDPCDYVLINGMWCHIDDVRLNITVVPLPTGTEESSWGRVKGMFRRVL
jgi:hypothetical protein